MKRILLVALLAGIGTADAQAPPAPPPSVQAQMVGQLAAQLADMTAKVQDLTGQVAALEAARKVCEDKAKPAEPAKP